ncbi:11056_t:CDS:2 [Funneliformis geosporum]|nr:11056_t:CDS:2 [Funneliformis geosporum]
MACLKLFSGDLPEITHYILQYLRNDLKSLYSCVLVNRHLCRTTIPILWKNPFSIKRQEGNHHNFLDIYYLFFSENDKAILKEFGIMIDSTSLKYPLFNYPKFIKTIKTLQLEIHIVNWINNLDVYSGANSKSTNSTNQVKSNRKTFLTPTNVETVRPEILRPDIGKNFINSKKIISSITTILFRLFLNNHASLNCLSMNIKYSHNHLSEIYEMISSNPTFTSSIENLKLSCSGYTDFIQPSVKHLDICATGEKFLANLLQSQTEILSLSFCNIKANNGLFDAFKDCSTLTVIRFINCDFTKISSFLGFKYLTQLESLHIVRCKELNAKVFRQLLEFKVPLKIKSLIVVGQVSGIGLLFQKVGPFLKYLELNLFANTEIEVLESIIIYCDKVRLLHLSLNNYSNLPQLYKVIAHFNKQLKYLSLKNKDFCFLTKELGQALPESLEYLDIDSVIDPNELQIFLNNVNVGLNKFLVRNCNTKNIDITFNVIKEFVKEKGIKNFAYKVNSFFNPENLEHNNLEKLVYEIQPYLRMKRVTEKEIVMHKFCLEIYEIGNVKVAENGNKVEQHNLGEYYELGNGVENGLLKAFDYYQNTANQEYLNAKTNMILLINL